jgi:hypothetical protein
MDRPNLSLYGPRVPGSAGEALDQSDSHRGTARFADLAANIFSNGQLVGPIAESHERALELVPVHRGADLDQASGPEVLGRAWHDHVGMSALGWALLHDRSKGLVERSRVDR